MAKREIKVMSPGMYRRDRAAQIQDQLTRMAVEFWRIREHRPAVFGAALGGILGGLLGYPIVTCVLHCIGEPGDGISLGYLAVLGILVGLMSSLALMVQMRIGDLAIRGTLKGRLVSVVTVIVVALGVFLCLRYAAGNGILAWLLLSVSFSFWIYLGSHFMSGCAKGVRSKGVLGIVGSAGGGIISGVLVGLAFLWRVSFSADEGFSLLYLFLLAVIGAVIGASIGACKVLLCQVFHRIPDTALPEGVLPGRFGLLSVFLVVLMIVPMVTFQYYGAMGLNEEVGRSVVWDEEDIFSDLTSDGQAVSSSYNTADLVDFLKALPDKDVAILANLYLLSEDYGWAEEFKAALLEEARNGEFLGISSSVKAWQYDAMIRGYYYLLVTERAAPLFSDSDEELVLDWFAAINRAALETGWVDYIYGLLFKEMPDGPYGNQEIGAGLLAVMSEVLQEKYPELAEEDRDYIYGSGVGWAGNFRNPDDGIVYHHTIWLKNAYMMAEYGGLADTLGGSNCRAAFEWVLKQWPPNGMSPAYNMPDSYTSFGVMVLGAYLFQDGRYKWLAERMLADEILNGRQIVDNILGLSYWDDELAPVQPDCGSCCIMGTTGLAGRPGPLEPDKVVFRNGWEEDSLYALLNLRFSGWHSYPATNCVISVMYGVPFVVEDLEMIEHDWLPAGKADHRDKKIDRTDLNGFQIKLDGLEMIVHRITGVGSAWHQDPPCFADVVSFHTSSGVDFSATRISDWHGWDHDRVAVLVEDGFLAVLDHAESGQAGEVAVTWHLKGEATVEGQSIGLSQDSYAMTVHFPHSDDWYAASITDTEHVYPPAGDVHDSDLTLGMTSLDRSEVGFVTVFCPDDGMACSVEAIEVMDDEGRVAYPEALGLRVIEPSRTTTIGSRFAPGEFTYGDIKTDSETFVVHQADDYWSIEYETGTFFEIGSDFSPTSVRLDGQDLLEGRDWHRADGMVVIDTAVNQGSIEVEF